MKHAINKPKLKKEIHKYYTYASLSKKIWINRRTLEDFILRGKTIPEYMWEIIEVINEKKREERLKLKELTLLDYINNI